MRRQIAYAAVAVSAIAGVAACGTSTSTSGSGSGGSAPAAGTSLSVKPAVALQNAVTYLTKHSFHFTANGDVDATGLGSLSKSLGSLGTGAQNVTIGLTGDITELSGNDGKADIKATFSGSGTIVNVARVFTNGNPLELRLVANPTTTSVYVNIGQPVGGKNWLAVNSASTPDSPSGLEQSLNEIAWFGDAGDLKAAGSGPNGTVELTSTLTAASVQAAEASATGAEAKALRSIAHGLAASPNATVTTDFWVDPSSYAPAKASVTFAGAPDLSKLDFTLTFSNFDEPINVTVPNASDTYSAEQLSRLLSQS